MSNYSSTLKICPALLIILIASGCAKPDKEEIKDQYISGFVNEINTDSLLNYVTWMQNMSTRFMLADNHRQVAARVMKKRSFIPSSTIQFVAFGAEELGLFGSSDFAQKASARGDKIKMMLNNDMIGYPSSPDPGLWYVNIIDYENSHYLRSEAQRLCERYSSVVCINDNANAAKSDSYPFYLNGFKPLFFIQNTPGSTYHTEDDLASTLNFQYCREIAKISCALLIDKNYPE